MKWSQPSRSLPPGRCRGRRPRRSGSAGGRRTTALTGPYLPNSCRSRRPRGRVLEEILAQVARRRKPFEPVTRVFTGCSFPASEPSRQIRTPLPEEIPNVNDPHVAEVSSCRGVQRRTMKPMLAFCTASASGRTAGPEPPRTGPSQSTWLRLRPQDPLDLEPERTLAGRPTRLRTTSRGSRLCGREVLMLLRAADYVVRQTFVDEPRRVPE